MQREKLIKIVIFYKTWETTNIKLMEILMMKLQRIFETSNLKEIEGHQIIIVIKLTTVIDYSQKSSDLTDKKINVETFHRK